MSVLELANQLKAQFGDLLSAPAEFRGEITLQLADPEKLVEVCTHAKQALGFDYLVDISSVDNYGDDPRWTLVYELSGIEHRAHLRLKTNVSEERSELPTVTGLWRTADWHERETFDLFGIIFDGHPDLRRILLPDDWQGHALRKDFPLAGKTTDLPDVAFSKPAPLEGGPFVTLPGGKDAGAREPRVRTPETEA